MEQSESIKDIATALATVQPKMHAALKDRDNPFFKSSYATLNSVWDACRNLLGEAGLSVVQLPTNAEAGRVGLTTMLMHTSGQYIRETYSTRLSKDDPQSVGSGITYLRRYALSAMLGIVTEEDDDGNAASQQPARPQQQQRPAAKPAQTATNPYAKTFMDLLEKAIDGRNLGAGTAAATTRAMASLKKNYSMDSNTVTPEVGGKLIAAINDGKFDPKPTKQQEAA